MKKFLASIIAVCFALCSWAETEFTFTSASDMNQTKDGITVTIAKGSGSNAPVFQNPYYNSEYHPEMRLYLGNTITVSSEEKLTNIQMVFAKSGASNKEYTGLEASIGSLVSGGVSESATDWKVDSWTGETTSVAFTLTGKGQRQIQKIVVNGEQIVIDSTENVLPTVEDLDPDYTYAEPTVVLPKDTTILKQEYAFISNNILVHCSQGSILKATDTTEAYFNCNAGYTLVFTATKQIKSIEIDGFIRKAFSATCEPGVLTSKSDPDNDVEGDKVVTIRDINADSVTLFCEKQVRCTRVRIYFEETQGIEDIQPSSGAQKIFKDGQLFIRRDEKTYTVTGFEI